MTTIFGSSFLSDGVSLVQMCEIPTMNNCCFGTAFSRIKTQLLPNPGLLTMQKQD